MNKPSPRSSGHDEFTVDEDHVDTPFHRFQALKATNFPAAARHFAEFQAALTRRIQWEEDHVFPEFLKSVGGRLESTCAALRAEHRKIASLLEAITAKWHQGNPATDAEELALQQLLAAHNHQEHSVVFPALE